MEYTKEEITMMRENVKQIENWIATNIIPYTRKYFEVGWGGKYRAPFSFDGGAYNFHIGVYPDLKRAALGEKYGPNRTFIMPKDEWKAYVDEKKYPYYSSSSGYGSHCIYSLPYAMHEVISNWYTIKSQLLSNIAEQKQSISAISSFQL